MADIVAKRFFAFRCATLIQEIDLARKIDSIDAPVGFDSCVVGGGRRLLQQNRTKADKIGFWPATACPLLTRCSH